MQSWIDRLIWIVICGLGTFAIQVAIYVILGSDPVELVANRIKVLSFQPQFLPIQS